MVWIICTVVAPGGLFAALAFLPSKLEWSVGAGGLAVFVLHLVSSVKVGKGGSGWLTAGLIFGGWALMLVSMFVGCVVLASR